MTKFNVPSEGFVCPFRDHCPHLEGLSTHWVFSEYQRSTEQENEDWNLREHMAVEIRSLEKSLQEKESELRHLRAENKMLHQRQFKSNRKRNNKPLVSAMDSGEENAQPKKRGAPKGHPPWTRKVPERIDQTIEVDPPCFCPHCNGKTDTTQSDSTSFIQEDILLKPQTVVTEYIHNSAYCPKCRRQVIRILKKELPFAPIGPNAKTAALYLRHELKLPYRKIAQAMENLFGLPFVAASSLGFEKRALGNGRLLYEDLIQKIRCSDLVHGDETHWREDGVNHYIWYAGNQNMALFHIDRHRSSEAAKVLLGERLPGLLVTDAYAAYNAITVRGRQSCLAHLLRKAKDLLQELGIMKNPDQESIRFCKVLAKLFQFACRKKIPASRIARTKIKNGLLKVLDLICEKRLSFDKAETLRKRLIPGAREYDEVFTFLEYGGPPTNNHAERALRPLVIFRKVCFGTRSPRGSENIGVFASLTQTAHLQGTSTINLFNVLLTGSASQAQEILFGNRS